MMPTNEYGRDLMGGAMGDYNSHSAGYGNGAGMVSHFFDGCWRREVKERVVIFSLVWKGTLIVSQL
uniref:Uncharacterized protein n=1 Tax=Parascaris equorum TaxID=6256 RepID=A0A914RMI6_PAREQ